MKNDLNKDQFRPIRLVRTSGSDQFVLYRGMTRLCHVHAHYAKSIHLDIILDRKFSKNLIDKVVNYVESLVDTSDSEDLILSVYVANELFSSSREVDWSLEPASKAEIKELSEHINKQLGRYANAAGRIIENITSSFFEREGYSCRRATPSEDAGKIDIVASKADHIILIQCKAGELSYRTMLQYCDRMYNFPEHISTQRKICFVAKSFPKDFIFNIKAISERFKCDIMTIGTADLLREFPEVNQTIG